MTVPGHGMKTPRQVLALKSGKIRVRSPSGDSRGALRVKSEGMNKIHWPRVLGCGLLAGGVWIYLGSLVTALLAGSLPLCPITSWPGPPPDLFC